MAAPRIPSSAATRARRAWALARNRAAALGARAGSIWREASERAHESIVARGLGAHEELSRHERDEIARGCADADPRQGQGAEKNRTPRL